MKAWCTAFGLLVAAAAVAAPGDLAPVFKLYLEQPGIYRVSHEELVVAGLDNATRSSAGIGLRSMGEPVALWVHDGPDGVFGDGDWLEFVGEQLHGEVSFLDEYSRYNCYVLRFDDPAPLRYAVHEPSVGDSKGQAAQVETWFHLEQDLLRLRFEGNPDEVQEVWYWAKLSRLREHRFRQDLSLHDLDRSAGEPVQARINLRAWSSPRGKNDSSVRDHEIRVMLNSAEIGSDAWDGRESHTYDLSIPADAFSPPQNSLLVKVPRRFYGEGEKKQPLVDVVMLNWIEMRYPRTNVVDGGQARFVVAEGSEGRAIRLESLSGAPLSVYSSDGRRVAASGADLELEEVSPGVIYFASTVDQMLTVDHVVRDRPSLLRTTTQQADYVMISHRSLMDAVEPLAELHRSRGLRVLLVDVQDVFDEFNHGIVHPRALRDFVSHAYHHWQAPRLRYVLLVGDASWDFKNPVVEDANYADWTFRPGERWRFIKNDSSPYAEGAERNDRNLVPTWNYATYQGYAASDTWFACVDGDDLLPDVAIGRFPVVAPEHVTAIVNKTIAYVATPQPGPWRRTALFIANESSGFQRRSDTAASRMAGRGWNAVKIYPDPSVETNPRHTRRILEAFNAGVQIVHFVGHGGRYIWRTGPPDLKFNHDLFTLKHLDELDPNRRLPIVLSLTCYSAPFDHPSADSLGEKLLRVDGRGAIAVVAASWRNSPTARMAQAMLDELTEAGNAIGEGVRRAKHRMRSKSLVQMYNLLGDPAAPVAAPLYTLELEASNHDNALVVRGTSPDAQIGGEVLLEWMSDESIVVHTQTLPVLGSGFTASVALDELPDTVEIAGVRAYEWNTATGFDAVGWAELAPAPLAESPTQSASRRSNQGSTP